MLRSYVRPEVRPRRLALALLSAGINYNASECERAHNAKCSIIIIAITSNSNDDIVESLIVKSLSTLI